MVHDVCQNCCTIHRSADTRGWDEYDENKWCGRMVICPASIAGDGFVGSTKAMVFTKPPKWCPYALEHEVIGQR